MKEVVITIYNKLGGFERVRFDLEELERGDVIRKSLQLDKMKVTAFMED